MSTKNENTPSAESILPGQTIELETRFGSLSRGKCWGKYFAHKSRPTGDFEWVEKSGGTLYLTGPGYYVVGSSDGFSRKAQSEFCLTTKVRYEDKTTVEKIAWQKECIAELEAKDPDFIITVTMPNPSLGLVSGQQITRRDLIVLRKAEIAKLEASGDRSTVSHLAQAAQDYRDGAR